MNAVMTENGSDSVLRTREVRREHFDFLIERIMEQAAALYANWPLAA